jgi:phosphoribosylformylglycinamidine (FGAM) synthase-like enzyme
VSAFDSGGLGFEVDAPELQQTDSASTIPATPWAILAALFGESASRAVVSVRPGDRAALLQMAAEAGVPAQPIGKTGGTRLVIRCGGEAVIDLAVAEAERIWTTAIERHFRGRAA